MNEITAFPMKPRDSGQSALGIHPCFCCSDGLPLPLQILGAPPLISLHSLFCLLSYETFQDQRGLSEYSYSKVLVDSICHSKNTSKVTHCWVLLLPLLSLSKVITVAPPKCPDLAQQQQQKRINSPWPPGSWSIMGKAGPVSALVTLKLCQQVPGVRLNNGTF